jgi:hypothetical protein
MGVIYFTLFESSVWQATFGKRLLDIHVTDDEGRRIGIRRALGRWFWKILLGYFWVNIASLATIPSTKEKKALHDYPGKNVGREGTTSAGRFARSLARCRRLRHSLRLADGNVSRNL